MKQFQQVAVCGVITNGKGEFLMVKRSDEDDFLPGYWEVPGGGTDYGEHPIKALERELKEETGLDVVIERPFYIDDYYMEGKDGKIQRVELFFACRLKDTTQEVTLSNEHSEYRWLGKESLDSVEMTDYQQKAMRAYFEK